MLAILLLETLQRLFSWRLGDKGEEFSLLESFADRPNHFFTIASISIGIIMTIVYFPRTFFCTLSETMLSRFPWIEKAIDPRKTAKVPFTKEEYELPSYLSQYLRVLFFLF